MLFYILAPILIFSPQVGGQLSLYGNWTPTVIRYCETVTSTQTSGGVVCGYSSYNAMQSYWTINIDSTESLKLINVGWMTTVALNTERAFWKACKSYMVRLFDGLYLNPASACALVVNPPTGVPLCNDTAGNLLYRSGSGYCMKEKVCGATSTIDFLAGPGNSSLVYSWEQTKTDTFLAAGFTKVGSCYGYGETPNPNKDSTNLQNGDSFY